MIAGRDAPNPLITLTFCSAIVSLPFFRTATDR
jgi:hypothetical protein